MTSSRPAVSKIMALMLVLVLFDLSLEVSFASSPAAFPSVQVSGRLSTRGNRAIVVNGNNTESGATILDGATIETPDGTGATISLGSLGEIDLAPNTVAVINFTDGVIKVTLKRGCAVVRRREGADGSIITPDGTIVPANEDDSNNRKKADVCFPLGATTPVVNAGAAANAGAGAGGGGGAAAGGSVAGGAGGGGGGLSAGAIAGIVVGGIVAVVAIIGATGGETDNASAILPGF